MGKEYIEREAALNAAHKIGKKEYDLGRVSNTATVMVVEDYLRAIPTADVVERKHGKWVDDKGNPIPWDEQNKNCPHHSAYCSECGEWLTASDEYPAIGNFCPNCGARMDGNDDG